MWISSSRRTAARSSPTRRTPTSSMRGHRAPTRKPRSTASPSPTTNEETAMTAATGSEQTVVVPAGADMIVAHVEGHSWVALRLGDENLIIDRGGQPTATFVVAHGTYVVHTDGSLGEIDTETLDPAASPKSAAVLRLTIDAPDNHAADGVAELPADGSAFGTVTVTKHDLAGEVLTGKDDTDEVYLRTTGGQLQGAKGSGPV